MIDPCVVLFEPPPDADNDDEDDDDVGSAGFGSIVSANGLYGVVAS